MTVGNPDETIYAITDWSNNSQMIEDVYDLGYIKGDVVDVTVGEKQGFWKWPWWEAEKIASMQWHDLYHYDEVDFRELPEPDATYDTVIFDPPYKLNGTPALGEMDVRYGVDRTSNRWQDTHDTIALGIYEAERVLKPKGHLLLKCQNQVCSGRVRFQTDIFTRTAEAVGLVKVEQLEFLRAGRPQPKGTRQVHARRNHSTLLIFEKPAR